MSPFIANARMYAVTPEAEAAWRQLLARICEAAEVAFDYVFYPAPRPLEQLWARGDLGAVFMCGYPIALRLATAIPIAAPIPAASWARGQAVYRTDLIVRADAPFETLADTFGGRLGWTIGHSHSGFNALRHHLLKYRAPDRPALFARSIGNLVTARRILDAVLAQEIDVGPIDAYWLLLIQRYAPDLTANIRVVETTDTAPIPAIVAAPGLPRQAVARLKQSFVAARRAEWFPPLAEKLALEGFVSVTVADFAPTLAWDTEAKAALYPLPA